MAYGSASLPGGSLAFTTRHCKRMTTGWRLIWSLPHDPRTNGPGCHEAPARMDQPISGPALAGAAQNSERGVMTDDLREPNKAVDYILANDGKFSAAKAQRVYLEEFR